ncbi:MAG: Rieske 2Fe-2S domain-containing protein [Actinobacteria bacterium]|nr:Rieske 2Fe-2S domain-containing protein [Actinomycetota bacterium]
MEASSVLVLAISALVALAALVLFTTTRRTDTRSALSRETIKRDRGSSAFLGGEPLKGAQFERLAGHGGPSFELAKPEPAPVAVFVPPDAESFGVTRRHFLNVSMILTMGLGLSGFGASVLAFLWPAAGKGFGGKIRVGKLEDILSAIRDTRKPFYVPEGRFYLNPYPTASIKKAESVYSSAVIPGMSNGVIALYQKCVHLGCRVPWCETSQWFECPCHGSQYNRVGEKKGGPAPRGLDTFVVTVENGLVTVDTGVVVGGVPIGTNTTGQEAEGPHCAGGGH